VHVTGRSEPKIVGGDGDWEREGGKKKKGTVEPVYGRRAPYYVT
jgi:hypothetical protein